MKMIKDVSMVYKIDAVIVVLTLIGLAVVGGYAQPLVIAPLNELETTETEILFLIEKAEVLLIDDNIEFSTPTEYVMKDGLKIDLGPGKYYWKAVGITSSEVRTLTIRSEVNLELREFEDDEFSVVNAGNVVLDVEVYDGEDLVENVKLGIGENVDGPSHRDDLRPKVIGREYDE